MVVNLNGLDLTGGSAAGSTTASSTRKTSSVQSAAAAAADATQQPENEVRITSTASLLAHLQQSLVGKPAFNQSRVDAITKALAEGKYSVNAERIANGLIQAERTLSPLPLPEI